MPERTEFEEKEYEQPLNRQLLLGSNNLWSPGQVFEKKIGIDSAILATKVLFWHLFNYKNIPAGSSLSKIDWRYFRTLSLKERKRLPSFKVNLLIQAKRPHYRYGVNSDYAAWGITNDYWYFNTTPHQQKILEKLERKLNRKALVVYACPAFHKFSDLDKYISTGKLVSNSTFVKPSKLKNHSKWVYDTPGTVGLANPEIERHSDDSFEKQLEQLSIITSNEINSSVNDTVNNLLLLEKVAIDLCKEELYENTIAKAFLRRRDEILEILEIQINIPNTIANRKAVRAYVTFECFVQTLNLSWWTI